jgi:hypothetical protein
MDGPRWPYGTDGTDAVIRMLESWLLRRTLLRLSISDFGRPVADVIGTAERR